MVAEILISSDANDAKISKMENLIVWISRELGIFYEEQLVKFTGYIRSKSNLVYTITESLKIAAVIIPGAMAFTRICGAIASASA